MNEQILPVDSGKRVRIDGSGRNAFDFHIPCHLGEGNHNFPTPVFVVLSIAKDFDPVLRHLVTHFRKELTGVEIKQAVGHLLEAGLIAETEGR